MEGLSSPIPGVTHEARQVSPELIEDEMSAFRSLMRETG